MISIFEIFKVSLGPSSSHTMGPMLIANDFCHKLLARKILARVTRLQITLLGSLAFTGLGHATDKAIIWGLLGIKPDNFVKNQANDQLKNILSQKKLKINSTHEIDFDYDKDLLFDKESKITTHPNTMIIKAFSQGNEILSQEYYSIGGGFFTCKNNQIQQQNNKTELSEKDFPYIFNSGQELLQLCQKDNLTIAQLMMKNELYVRSQKEIHQKLDNIWQVMHASINAGLKCEGYLPGWLKVQRRAPILYKKFLDNPFDNAQENIMDWLNLYAMAVNEENAMGGKIITAPTNGASGLMPSLIKFYCTEDDFTHHENIYKFLLTAAAVGILYKQKASISGAEMGCQGEVGVACSMSAAGLCAIWGGSINQIECAAEIAMEHNLGLTCDPVGGLVQIPCIERNAIGAVKAVNAARLAMHSDGKSQHVSLDQIIETMRQTGNDMSSKYKETSQGGLAVNVVEC